MFGWPKAAAPAFEVVHGDIFVESWQDNADLVFIASTCFKVELMQQVYEKSLLCKAGTWLITLSKSLPEPDSVSDDEDNPSGELHWEFIRAIKLQVTWGYVSAFVHRKITNPVSK